MLKEIGKVTTKTLGFTTGDYREASGQECDSGVNPPNRRRTAAQGGTVLCFS